VGEENGSEKKTQGNTFTEKVVLSKKMHKKEDARPEVKRGEELENKGKEEVEDYSKLLRRNLLGIEQKKDSAGGVSAEKTRLWGRQGE